MKEENGKNNKTDARDTGIGLCICEIWKLESRKRTANIPSRWKLSPIVLYCQFGPNGRGSLRFDCLTKSAPVY